MIPTAEDVLAAMVSALSASLRGKPIDGWSQLEGFEADVWLPNIIANFYRAQELDEPALRSSHRAPFYDAAWDLCRQGVLRPGPAVSRDDMRTGSAYLANGYSITAAGREWLLSDDRLAWLMPGRLVELLRPKAGKFGPAFLPRVIEAAACQRAGLHMSACVMAGAAVECILLALAGARLGDANKALNQYQVRQGRKQILDCITGALRSDLRGKIETLSETVSYWRDGAAHGVETHIGEVQASHALDQLLRLSNLADDHWDEITAQGQRRPG